MPENKSTRLRIALVAPIARAVSRHTTGSIELLVALLAEGLLASGHEVTVFASGDSTIPARLRSVYPHGYTRDERLWDWQFHETLHLAAAFESARDFDVIHSHVYHFLPPLARLTATPAVHTDHILANQDILAALARYSEVTVAALSQYHRSKLRELDNVSVVPNGIDVASFPFGAERGNYLMFLGHLIPKKGPLEAIRLAKAAGMRLVMAGKGGPYYQEEVAPHVDGKAVTYLGPVEPEKRNWLLAEAGALIFTSEFLEPFGLVLVEAMACGTPVVALERCAVAEIVDYGVSGYYAPDTETLAELVPAALELDRARIRREAFRRFDYRRMVEDYERLYRQTVARHRPSMK